MMKKLPPLKLLESRLQYDAETGELWRKFKTTNKLVTTVSESGYNVVRIMHQNYFVHRIAWFMHHKEEPPKDIEIDHIDGDKTNNRIDNLRLATHPKDMKLSERNKTGFRGVCYHSERKKYEARIYVDGKSIFLGYHSTAEDASNARANAEKELVKN